MTLLLATGCTDNADPNNPPDPNSDDMTPVLIGEVTLVTPGGKRPGHAYWVWNPDEQAWEKDFTVIGPITRPGLGAGARAAATSTGGGSATGQANRRPNAALFAGGIGDGSNRFASPQAYFFDLAENQWTALEMSDARYGHTLTTLLDGRILIAGGWDGTQVPNANGGLDSPSLTSTELFSPASASFSAGGPLLTPRAHHAAALLADGRVLITGGYDGATNTTATAEIYDPASNSFAATGSMGRARSSHLAVALDDGRVLVLGDNASAGAEVFDPAAGTFSPVGDMAAIHGFGATATKLKSGAVLILGGAGDGRGVEPTAAADLFDPASNTFTAVGPMAVARKLHVAVLQDDGTVLVAGGNTAIHNGPNVSFEATAKCERFDPATGTFAALPDAPEAFDEGAGVFLKR